MSELLKAADLFHTGIVVPDLEDHARRLSAAAGYRWTAVQTAEIPIRTAGETRVLRLRYVYSLDEPTVELTEEVPGTPWTAPPGGPLHHLGYFCDDLPGAAAELVGQGFRLEAHPVVDGAMAVFAYLVDPAGVRFELIERRRIPDLDEYKRARAPREEQP